MHVRGRHHLERVACLGPGIRAYSHQRFVEQPESIRRDPRQQRRLAIEVPIKRAARNAGIGPDPAESQSLYPVGVNHLERFTDEHTFKVAVVISSLPWRGEFIQSAQ